MIGFDLKRAQNGPRVSLLRGDGRQTFDFTMAALPAGASLLRGSSATEVQANGDFTTRSNDVPRFDHSAVTGAALGLLLELPATNLVTHAIPTAATWIADSCSAVDLNLNALGMFPGVTVQSTGFVWGRLKQNITLATGLPHRITCFMRAGTAPNARIAISGGGGETHVAGAIGAMSNSRSDLGACSGITQDLLFDGATRRITFEFLPTVTGSYQIGLGPQSGTSGLTVELLGLQVVQGSDHSSFIPSAAVTATRAADQLHLALADGTYDITRHYAESASQTDLGVDVVSGYAVPATGDALRSIVAIPV